MPLGKESDVVTIREDGKNRSQHAIDLVDEVCSTVTMNYTPNL